MSLKHEVYVGVYDDLLPLTNAITQECNKHHK